MDQLASQLSNAELQALINAIPRDLTINTANRTNSSSSIGDLSSASSSCIFPPLSDVAALSMLSLTGYPGLFPGFPMFSSMPYFNPALPQHATIESLGLINSASLYPLNRDVQSAMSSPLGGASVSLGSDSRPRAFSSAATLQHAKPVIDQDKRRKRVRKTEAALPATTAVIACTPSTTTTTTAPSVLRTLVDDDDDVHPSKVRPIHVTKEEEELVRMKTHEMLKQVPIIPEADEPTPSIVGYRPLRRLIRDEDLPDEVGPDSPFRHYPKYQVHNRNLVRNS